jgi:hypothetical protein
MAAALADVLGATALLEPEEADWPEFVRRPHEHGDFTRLTWFRGQRVPLYYRARDLSVSGEVAILDSYYDKWCTGWLGRSGLEWLMAPDDPYFEVAASMAAVDARVLPRADVVVVLRISQGLWRRQLAERARGIDLDEAFVQSHHSQSLFVETALTRGPVDGTAVLVHDRQALPPREEAERVVDAIHALGVA